MVSPSMTRMTVTPLTGVFSNPSDPHLSGVNHDPNFYLGVSQDRGRGSPLDMATLESTRDRDHSELLSTLFLFAGPAVAFVVALLFVG